MRVGRASHDAPCPHRGHELVGTGGGEALAEREGSAPRRHAALPHAERPTRQRLRPRERGWWSYNDHSLYGRMERYDR